MNTLNAWSNTFPLNTSLPDDQSDPTITDIGNGQFVAIFADKSGAWTGSGYDLVARIFDVEGNPTGDAFLVTPTSSGFGAPTDDSAGYAVTSLPGGGFAIAYIAANTVIVDTFDGDGVHVDGTVVQPDGSPTHGNPTIAVRSDGAMVVAYRSDDTDNGGSDIAAARVISADGTVGSAFELATDTLDPLSLGVLPDGTFVAGSSKVEDDGSTHPGFVVFDETGVILASRQVTDSESFASAPQLTVLPNGTIALAWYSDFEKAVRVGVYDADGNPVSGTEFIDQPLGTTNLAPQIAPLADGGFVVSTFLLSGEASTLQRFDANGDPVGDPVFVEVPAGYVAVFAFDVTLLEDGRIAVALLVGDAVGNSDTVATILDPRGPLIEGSGDADIITSRLEGGTVNGLDGDDRLLGQEGADVLKGGAGADELLGRDGDDKLVGGAQADLLAGGLGADILKPGKGKDQLLFDTALSKANADTVKGFKPGKDTVLLDAAIFSALGDKVNKGEFRTAKKAKDGNDHLLYHEKSGKLFYDDNGDAGGGRTLVATFKKSPDLDHKDFDILTA